MCSGESELPGVCAGPARGTRTHDRGVRDHDHRRAAGLRQNTCCVKHLKARSMQVQHKVMDRTLDIIKFGKGLAPNRYPHEVLLKRCTEHLSNSPILSVRSLMDTDLMIFHWSQGLASFWKRRSGDVDPVCEAVCVLNRKVNCTVVFSVDTLLPYFQEPVRDNVRCSRCVSFKTHPVSVSFSLLCPNVRF